MDKTISLFAYLRRIGAAADPRVRMNVAGQIADGGLRAYVILAPRPAPIGSGLSGMMKYYESESSRQRAVQAMAVRKVRFEVERAAMGLDAEWGILNELLVVVPSEPATEPNGVPSPPRHLYKHEKNLGLILDELRAGGFDPKALPAFDQGTASKKAWVREILVDNKKKMTDSQFKRAWEHGNKVQELGVALG